MEPSEDGDDLSLKTGSMILNRFCIDEDAAFQLSGVYYLETSSREMMKFESLKSLELKEKGRVKGKGSFITVYGILYTYFILRYMNNKLFPQKNILMRKILFLPYKTFLKT